MLTTAICSMLFCAQADDVLPDISLLASELANAFVTTSNPELPAGTRALRFSTASVNFGPGRLEMRGGQISGNTQLVNQRIFRTDGTFWDRPAGTMTYHPSHGHIHFDDWTQFRLRAMTPSGGVGDVVATGAKTSFCIIELRNYDPNAPGHGTPPAYNSCGQVQGLRPGWADVYGSSLTGQFINLTGIADGVYWLEGDIDPDGLVMELDETNNQVRIPVAIGDPPVATPDAYEENDSKAQVDSATAGGTNSPNFGLVLEEKIVQNLSQEDSADWFRFQIHAGVAGSYVRMESPYLRQANLNLELYNSAGTLIRTSANSYSWEQVSLSGLAAGVYYARVIRASTGNNPNYRLTISPSENTPPVFNMDAPTAGEQWVEKSLQTIYAQWNGNDPDLDPKYVTLLRTRMDVLDPSADPIPGYELMPNPAGNANINTADFGYGRWRILGIGTDGAAETPSFAPGVVWIYRKGDINYDGHVHEDDYLPVLQEWKRGRGLHHPWSVICDYNRDGQITIIDMKLFLDDLGHDH